MSEELGYTVAGIVFIAIFIAVCVVVIPFAYHFILRILHDLSKSVSGGWEKGKDRR